MTKNQNPKPATGYQAVDKSPERLGHWTFEFGYYLKSGAWNLLFPFYPSLGIL
jgi:hypothetical protein